MSVENGGFGVLEGGILLIGHFTMIRYSAVIQSFMGSYAFFYYRCNSGAMIGAYNNYFEKIELIEGSEIRRSKEGDLCVDLGQSE